MVRHSSGLHPTTLDDRQNSKSMGAPWAPRAWWPSMMPSRPQSWWQGPLQGPLNAHYPYGVVPGAVAATLMAQMPAKRWLTEQASPSEGEIDPDEDGDIDSGVMDNDDVSMLLQDVRIIS